MSIKDRTPALTRISNSDFQWGNRTFIIGILNVTPDSFSGDGVGADIDAAIARAKQLVMEGADIIDVGGESTRPGAPEVTSGEEITRVVPVIRKLASEIEVPISVDTYKSEVADAAVRAGASMINSVYGLKRDPKLAEVASRLNVPIILTSSQRDNPATDIIKAILADLGSAVSEAESAGIKRENIIVDPGFGFGKTVVQNLELLKRLDEFRCLGKPILLGTSRKSTIGKILGDVPLDQRLFGTVATTVISIMNGADIVRVHDVKENVQAARMTDAVIRCSLMGENQFHKVYLSLGSNLGDRLSNLESAVKLLRERISIARISPVYQTEPVGVTEQPKFLNMVVEVCTVLAPGELLLFLKDIEQQLGRGSAGSEAPRPIDIDILFYDTLVMTNESLVIPHPRLSQRAFVLVPLHNLVPDLVHPVLKKTVREMLSALNNPLGVEFYRCNLPNL
ncbi:dihydropteroate synthase [Dehalogenimonas etheniformans]|nr:dihydropteroate synthase [Dehalogenimonas etheniformans]